MDISSLDDVANENEADDARLAIEIALTDPIGGNSNVSNIAANKDEISAARVVMRRRLRSDWEPIDSPDKFVIQEPYEVQLEVEELLVDRQIPELPHPRIEESSKSSAFAEIFAFMAEIGDDPHTEKRASSEFGKGQGHLAIESLKYFLDKITSN